MAQARELEARRRRLQLVPRQVAARRGPDDVGPPIAEDRLRLARTLKVRHNRRRNHGAHSSPLEDHNTGDAVSTDELAAGSSSSSGGGPEDAATRLDEVLKRLQTPGLHPRERAKLQRLAKFLFRVDKARSRFALKQSALDIKGRNVELRNPELQAQVERLQGANKDLKQALGIGQDDESTIGQVGDALSNVVGAYAGGGAAPQPGDPDFIGPLPDETDTDGSDAPDDGSTPPDDKIFGLPKLVVYAGGGLALLLLLKRKKG